jgi:hypothetical protein
MQSLYDCSQSPISKALASAKTSFMRTQAQVSSSENAYGTASRGDFDGILA